MGKLFQHGTIGALMAGFSEGSLTIEALLKEGDIGIGTLHQLDGELVIVDGVAYQVKIDGSVLEIEGRQSTPYAAVVHFQAEKSVEIDAPFTADEFKDKLRKAFSSLNTFQAVKVSGTFSKMHCRSVDGRQVESTRLVHVAKNQAEFTRKRVTGTLVGFYTPEFFQSIAVADFHWHFLSEEKDFGGHVFDFEIMDGVAEWQTIERLEQSFPVQNEAFMTSEIDYSHLLEDIEKIE